ncbi:MAG: universal stress protein [Thermococci archaeon]|nr:universal stress protein [Thermococci archaeon]
MIFGRILLPTDFGVGYEEALAKLEKMKVQADEVVLLHVIDEETLRVFMKEHRATSTTEAEEILRDIAERRLWIEATRVSRVFKTDNVRTIVIFGDPGRRITEVADREDASVVVIPSHGDPSIHHSPGSTTLKVISLSQAPILVIGVGQRRDEP